MSAAQPQKKAVAKTAVLQAPIFTEVQYYIHYVPEQEWKKAIDFFSETMGLVLKVDTGEGWAEFQTGGGIVFALHAAKYPAAKETGIVFHVMDCDEAANQLKIRGVAGVTEPKSVCEGTRGFDFKDPFGNTFGACGT